MICSYFSLIRLEIDNYMKKIKKKANITKIWFKCFGCISTIYKNKRKECKECKDRSNFKSLIEEMEIGLL